MSRFQLHVIEQRPAKSDRLAKIIRLINERFRTPEQFELQIDTICLDIAMAMRGRMDHLGSYFRHGDALVFNFTFLSQEQIVQLLESQSSDHIPCPSH